MSIHFASTLIGWPVSSPAGVSSTAPPSTSNGWAVSEVFVCTMAKTAAVSRSIVVGGGGGGGVGMLGCVGGMYVP
jgi:hypothetical protein